MRNTGQNTGLPGRDLRNAIRTAQAARQSVDDSRIATSPGEGSDVAPGAFQMREVQFRLALLSDALGGVFDELPQPRGDFILGVPASDPGRYVIDGHTSVEIDADLRTYRVVRNGDTGRSELLGTDDVEAMADAVTSYVAERIVDRQERGGNSGGNTSGGWRSAQPASSSSLRALSQADGQSQAAPSPAMQGIFWAGAGFGLGVLAGIFLLLVYAWVAVG